MANTCFIIGAGPGLGASLASRFAAEGYAIGLVARNGATLTPVAAATAGRGVRVATATADTAERPRLEAAFTTLVAALGTPRVVIYNAFMRALARPASLKPEFMLEAVRVNVGGAINTAQIALGCLDRGAGASLFFTGGGAAIDPWPDLTPLGIAKAGVRNYAFNLSADPASEGVHVATVTICGHIEPGTAFDPDRLADLYWELHAERPQEWRTEIVAR